MYGILPANVRYQEGLSSFAKVIYSEINALSNKNGYCFASNAYFENVFKKSTATISRVLTELQDHGAIKIKDGSGGDAIRKITPCSPSQKLPRSAPQKLSDPLRKNEEQNNTSIIIQDTISKDIVEPSQKCLPVTGRSKLQRVISFYSLLWQNTYGTKPTVDFGRVGRTLKPLLEQNSEQRIALLLMQFFQWRGATGTDDFTFKRLSDNAFPLTWLPTNADAISAYIRNVLKVDIDNEKEVEKHLNRYLSKIGYPDSASSTSPNA